VGSIEPENLVVDQPDRIAMLLDAVDECLADLADLKARLGRLEGSLATTGPTQPPPDPSAVEAAEKMVKRRRREILKDAGLNGDDPDDEG